MLQRCRFMFSLVGQETLHLCTSSTEVLEGVWQQTVELCMCVFNPLITLVSLSCFLLGRDFTQSSAFPTNGQCPCSALCRCKSHYPLERSCSQFALLQCNQCSQMETALKFTFPNISFIFLFWYFLSGFPVVLTSLGLLHFPLSRPLPLWES